MKRKNSQIHFLKNDSIIQLKKINTINNFYINNSDIIFNKYYNVITCIYNDNLKSIYVVAQKNVINSKLILKLYTKTNYNTINKKIYNLLLNQFNKCQYIANYYNYIDLQHYFYTISEYVEGINLNTYILRNKIISDSNIITIIKQILLGIEYLHNHNIIHCDIKPHNIIINPSTLSIKIIDFDLAKILNKNSIQDDTITGTPIYMAPECHDLGIYNSKSDIWSIGIILYQLITHTNPLENNYNNSNLYNHNIYKDIDFNILPHFTHNKVLLALIQHSLIINYENRHDASSLLYIIDNY